MSEQIDRLKADIAAIARGDAEHDGARKALIDLARMAGLDMVPDNWAEDGSLRKAQGVWSTEEQRETYNDRRRAVESAISESLPKNDDGECPYCWVNDLTDEWAVYEYECELWQINYSLTSDGEVTLGTPKKVRQVTSYEANADREPSEKRLKPGMEACDTCDGTGEVENDTCEDCGGTGEVQAGEQNSAGDDLEKRKAMAARIEDTVERRDFTATDMEVRETSDGGLRFSGYASTTETPYEVADFEETIARGAFKRTLGEDPDVVLLINHEGLPLARTRSGTLTLSEDSRGLRVDADLDPSDPDVQSLLPKMKRQDLTEMSFAFRATKQTWDKDYTKRTILETSIHRGDVSMVTHGANTTTTGSVRSDNGELELRAGKTISAANEAVLKTVLNRIARADEEVDEAQPELAKVLGLPNPDSDEPGEDAPRSAPVSFIEQAKARRARALREAS